MAQKSVSEPVLDQFIEETRKAFEAHKEPRDETMSKKLIINIAANGSLLDRSHNPYVPVTTEEVVKEVSDAYNAGAAMWHIHPRDPETGVIRMPLEKRIKIHKEWCDAVFAVAPDIIIEVGSIYAKPPTLTGPMVDQESIMAENRVAPILDRLVQLGPKNRYVEIALSLCRCGTPGGTRYVLINNKAGIISDVELFQSRGIRVEIAPADDPGPERVKEWVIDSGIAKPPVIMDLALGIHNTIMPRPGIEGFELLLFNMRRFPKEVLWQASFGGRHWLPLAVLSIMLGCDIVRVGKEDSVYMYPHRDDYIKECGKVVETVAGIARYLGREVATPSEARTILSLPQIHS